MLIILFHICVSSAICSTIITKNNDTFDGEIKKTDSKKLYFVDTRIPDFLFIFDFSDLVSIIENGNNVIEDIMNNEKNGNINFNSFKKIVRYEEKTTIESLLAEDEKKKYDNNVDFLIKFNYEEGDIFFGSYRAGSTRGISLSLEMADEFIEKFYFGAGLIFQKPRYLSEYHAHQYNNLSFYGLAKFNVLGTENAKLFLNANFGINRSFYPRFEFHNVGTYMGVGFEIRVKRFLLEIAFKSFSSSFKDNSKMYEYFDYKVDMYYRTLSLSLGLNLL